ncbi:sulfotransferase family 2 domain-containing protein [Pseudooctadecabacter sp.]|uniref:sulfotransferase family 2 domain-containing protein n=1 Tax=Pseudooctadecabacter sp. TaxID=1966338 RepID=UPI0025DC3F25|nr:sulfotransferase family 2 domain-containing protein [Pseudooctadecabacter sp.]
MILNDRFLFIHIPKTGGKSVFAALSHLDNRGHRSPLGRIARRLGLRRPPLKARLRRHDTLQTVHRLTTGLDVFSFAVVRDPYAHAVSHYRHLKSQNKNRTFARLTETRTLAEFLRWRADAPPASRLLENKNLFFAKLPSQSAFVTLNGTLAVNRILKLETLEEDFRSLCDDLDLGPVALPRINVNLTAPPVHIDEEATALINQIYHDDFDTFGYPRRGI